MTATLVVRRMSEHVSTGRHPWEIGQVGEWRTCSGCGKLHYSGIRLCGPCCRRMQLWLADVSELRFIELASLDMGLPIRA